MRVRNRFAFWLAAVAVLGFADIVWAQAVIDCPFGQAGGDVIDRAFYVPDYPGDSLGIVLLKLSGDTPGHYTLKLTARVNTYDGSIIGVAAANTFFSGDHNDMVVVRFDFHGASVAAGETVTFTLDPVNAPEDAFSYFDTGIPCGNQVLQTEDAVPPLSEHRRDHFGVTIYTGVEPIPMVYWIAVVSHAPGANLSQWRSDLSLLNRGSTDADVTLRLHIGGSVAQRSLTVAAQSQEIVADVVAWIESGLEGSGPLEVVTDRPLEVDSRTYTAVDSAADCMPDGTFGQVYNGYTSHQGLVKNQIGVLPGLSENDQFRCNIGFSNTSAKQAVVVLTLHDADGTVLFTSNEMALAPGKWKQENRPFFKWAGRTDIDEGYATIEVVKGIGVQIYASLIDAVTNDAATIWMRPY